MSKLFFVITRYNEDLSWLWEYTHNNYLIYNKGEDNIDEFDSQYHHVQKVNNFGGNQYDICKYIYDNYDNLPEIICFLQGNPFDHCKKDKLDKIIHNRYFTAIESYEDNPENDVHKKDTDGGYMEINSGWYIAEHNRKLLDDGNEITCKFTFESLMFDLFQDYKSLSFIRFAPASQYLVERAHCLQYSRTFWKKVMEMFPTTIGINGGTEAHIIERAIYHILKGTYKARY